MILKFLFLMASPALAAPLQIVGTHGVVTYQGKPAQAKQWLDGKGILRARGKGAYVDLRSPGGVVRIKDGSLKVGKGIPRLKNGFLFAHIDAGKRFRFQTRSSTMGVRGTKFFVEERPSKTYLCVCEGSVWMKKKGKKRTVSAGEDLFDKKGQGLGQPKKANDRMWKMATAAFEAMKAPVKHDPR